MGQPVFDSLKDRENKLAFNDLRSEGYVKFASVLDMGYDNRVRYVGQFLPFKINVEKPRQKSTFKKLFSFSLKTFLLVIAMISVFLAGRASNQAIRIGDERPVGDWKMQMKAGFTRQVVIIETPEGDYELKAGGTVFEGVYSLQGDQLVMKIPSHGSQYQFTWE